VAVRAGQRRQPKAGRLAAALRYTLPAQSISCFARPALRCAPVLLSDRTTGIQTNQQIMSAPFVIILIISCFVALAMSGILFIIAKSYPKDIQGLNEWSASALILAFSFPLFMARDVIPDLFGIVLPNLLILAGFMVMNLGTRRFSGTRSKTNRMGLVLFIAAFVLLFMGFTYIHPDMRLRVATLSLFTLAVVLDQLLIVLKELPRTTGRNLLVFLLSMLIGSRVIRLVGLLLGFDHPVGIFSTSIAELAFIAVPSITIPLGAISFITLASERLRQDLEFISRHDDLTQCLNKKSAIDELQREISHAKRYGNKLSIMLIDLDNFKDINDSYGHLEGDKVLVDFSKKTKASLRAADQLTRFGGDEFMAILPDTNLEQAMLVTSRLHEAGEKSQPIAWSVSIGISEWSGEDDTLAALLTRADRALYESKASGRKQTRSV
jgi:diguanylate cyclase (GGDEF)-like protein